MVHKKLESKLLRSLVTALPLLLAGRIAFEKLTDFDYRGNTYYTVKNLSLYECQGWCREEPDCQAAAFSFVLNPLIPVQETQCQLQNETQANNPSATAQRSVNMYYMTKLQLRSDNICLRPWAFERVPNKMIRGLDNALIYTSTKEACLAACLNEEFPVQRPTTDSGAAIGSEKNTLPVVFNTSIDPTLNNLTKTADVNCDKTGTCYDVAVNCKDTKIAVSVRTNKPFNGRIYALGRSETCNVDVINSDLFRLDLTMTGQDCNTQSVTGVYSNTVVLQHHSVVMTKADKIYKVKCTYDMSSKNITFGMMPIRDPEMISITSAPEAPPPRIRILDSRLREVETVRIGDKLTFRIEIPEDTPYGIFARSCVAMAKDAKSTFQIIDDEGCPVDPSIFPAFTPDGNALQSVYEAFRFTESYGVIFQCNVKYCLGPCEPAVCEWGRDSIESWGRKKRSVQNQTDEEKEEDMTLSQEILVLDLGDEKQSEFLKSDPANADYGKDKTVTIIEPCPTKTSVLALGVTCALLVLLYISTLFCYYMKKWLNPGKHLA
ncbi:hypothetical protein D910_07242 [Dendroctonus ponderosae]|uniref:ZP domain-containing protein n=1 Tax=Dendroctonus ponderosae TaxID=77166 RepID=U4UC62_DENPD|nr:hypothetical protein D910_07242 [Dendroctonus ponderosae]